jgi:hypothetical protein
VRVTNCYSDELVAGVLETLNTQAFNTRAGPDRTYHLILSFAVLARQMVERSGRRRDAGVTCAFRRRRCAGGGDGRAGVPLLVAVVAAA